MPQSIALRLVFLVLALVGVVPAVGGVDPAVLTAAHSTCLGFQPPRDWVEAGVGSVLAGLKLGGLTFA